MTSDLSRLSSYQKLRTYLLMCAYNTGAGNVSRGFIGKTRLSEAFFKRSTVSVQMTDLSIWSGICRMRKIQHYLMRVNKRMELYR